MSYRTEIAIEYKKMVKEIGESLGGCLSNPQVVQMCIQSVYDNIQDGSYCALEDANPTQKKLDQIIEMLEEVMPEL